jgi:hypothetical protein
MNMNLNLNFNPQVLLKLLKVGGPYLLGLGLVGIFGYTGWVINQAFNVKPIEPATTATAKVVFDKQALETVKNLHVTSGAVAPTDLGKTDPFGQ